MNKIKLKRLIWITALLFMLILSTSRVNLPVVWAAPRIYVDPATVTRNPGETFTIDIMIENVVAPNGVNGWELMIKFDFSILNTESANITQGTFLSDVGPTFFQTTKIAAQSGWLIGCGLFVQAEAVGSGTLVTIEFEVTAAGATTLDLDNTDLRDDVMMPISHTADDGTFFTSFPEAKFDFNYTGKKEGYFAIVGQVINFNASDSKDFDGYIVSYKWDFGDGNITTVLNGSRPQYWLINHTYTSPGSYPVNLTVTDNEANTDWSLAAGAYKSVTVEFYDLVIIDVEVNPTIINPGMEPFPEIDITIFNNSSTYEYFNLTLYYGVNNPIWYNETIGWKAYMHYKFDEDGFPQDPLPFGENMTVTFTWNTTGVAEGMYNIWTNVSRMHPSGGFYLPGEIDLSDNIYNYGDVIVSKDAPIAEFTFTPQLPIVNELVTFDASASYDPDGWLVSYKWDFGDGNVTTVLNGTRPQYWVINHTYTSAGSYTVILTVTDNATVGVTRTRDIEVSVHDLAITLVALNSTTPNIGDKVKVSVTVKNEGGFEETATVTAYYEGNTIGMPLIVVLKEKGETGDSDTKEFTWDTTGLPMSTSNYTYTIRAEVSVVQNETNTGNNNKTVEVTIVTRNIAITNMAVSPTTPKVGDSLTISVTVTNEGSHTETFNVTAYSAGNTIGNYTNVTLTNGSDTTLPFTWNTAGVTVGTYTIKANVTEVEDEINKTDNEDEINIALAKQVSTISISVSSTNITLGDSVTISGSITPQRAGATVTIWFKLQGEESWDSTTVQTNSDSEYSYSWEPTESGTYEVKASWLGDDNALGDESEVETVNVGEAPPGGVPPIILYAAVGAIIAIGAVALIYFMKFRKPT